MGAAASLAAYKPRRLASPAQIAAAENLCLRVRDCSERNQSAEICDMHAEIQACVNVGANAMACGEMTFALGTALSATGNHMLALQHLNCACVLYTSLSDNSFMHLDTQKQCLHMQALLYSKIGREYTIVKNYAMAFQFLDKACKYHLRRVEPIQETVQHILACASALHLLGDFSSALQLVKSTEIKMERARHMLARASMSILKHSWHLQANCASLISGRCNVALGDFKKGLRFLVQAKFNAQLVGFPENIALAELNFAVAAWASEKWAQKQVQDLRFRGDRIDFIGPPLSQGMLLQHLANLAVTACETNGGRSGQFGVYIFRNEHKGCVSVREVVVPTNVPDTIGLLLCEGGWRIREENARMTRVTWPAAEPQQRDSKGSMLWIEITVTTGDKNRMYYKSNVSRTLENANMKEVNKSLDTVLSLSASKDLFTVQQDAAVYKTLLVLESRGDGCKVTAVESFKRYLQDQVNDAKQKKCFWCRQGSEDIMKCGGCGVVRFCGVLHQKMATKVSFMNLSISHKKICPLLKLCRSLTDLHVGSESSAANVKHVETYNEAIWKFLKTDILAKYVAMNTQGLPNKKHCTVSLDEGSVSLDGPKQDFCCEHPAC